MEFQNAVADFCRRHDLLRPGDKVICALSGGGDSVALLWSLYLLRDQWGLELSAAHFNHGLRGQEADRDEEFVRSLCQRLEISLVVGRGVVTPSGRGVEDAARKARYAFLQGLDADALIATAHTADDNGETVLLHLLRGSGLRGLGGIAPRRGRIIRPMLPVTRRDVEDFLSQWNLTYVNDSSNGEPDFLRNRLRQQVMPVLRRENPRFSRNCTRMALGLRQDEDFLSEQARAAMERVRRDNGLDCQELLALHPAMRNRVIADYLREAGVKEPEQTHITLSLELARSVRPSAWTQLPGGVCLRRQYSVLTAETAAGALPEMELPVPGRLRLNAWEISCHVVEKWDGAGQTPFSFGLSAELAGKTLLVRSRETGDALTTPGGHRSVKRAMIDRKIPASRREGLPVITDGQRVLAVAGLGADWTLRGRIGEPALLIQIVNVDTEGEMPFGIDR